MSLSLLTTTSTPARCSPLLSASRYHLLDEIGHTSVPRRYSQVFRALSRHSGQIVAIKQTRLTGLSRCELTFAQTLFDREAAILRTLAHPGIVRLLDAFRTDQRSQLVLEFIAGETLETVLCRRERQTLQEALSLGLQLALVLDYLHTQQRPIIHRDLKPANIVLRPNGQLCLLDFGIARRWNQEHLASGRAWRMSQGQAKAQADTISNMGTWGYAAPEQYGEDAHTSPQSDLYSLGVLLHQMLSGDDPVTKAPRALFTFAALKGRTHPALSSLIAQLVQRDPCRRPQSAGEVTAVLEQIALL